MKLSQAQTWFETKAKIESGAKGQWRRNSNDAWDDIAPLSAFCWKTAWEEEQEIRIKPEPKLRPWKPEEVPVGAILRLVGWGNAASLIVGRTNDSYLIWITLSGDHQAVSLSESLTKFEHSTDGGNTWKPCGVEE